MTTANYADVDGYGIQISSGCCLFHDLLTKFDKILYYAQIPLLYNLRNMKSWSFLNESFFCFSSVKIQQHLFFTQFFKLSSTLFLKRNYDPVGLAEEKAVQVLTFFARLPFLRADSYGMFTMNIHFSLEKATCPKFRVFDVFSNLPRKVSL